MLLVPQAVILQVQTMFFVILNCDRTGSEHVAVTLNCEHTGSDHVAVISSCDCTGSD
jgi:hypothetical protein